MCESQLLFLAKPGDFLLSAWSFIFPFLLEWQFPEVVFTSPAPGGWNVVGKKGTKSQRYQTLKALFKYLLGHCVVPYLVHKPPGQAWIRGCPTCASGSQQLLITFLIFLWARTEPSHPQTCQWGSRGNSCGQRVFWFYQRRRKDPFFFKQRCSLKGSNHTQAFELRNYL